MHLKRSFKSIASVGFAFAKLGFALQNLEAMLLLKKKKNQLRGNRLPMLLKSFGF